MDVIIFGGQSNMEGQTECVPSDLAPVEGALEYRYLTRSFVPLCHPVGEDIPPSLYGANYGFGSLLPDFCRAYRRVRGTNVTAVHAAKGDTSIAQWLPDGGLYAATVEKLSAALHDLSEKPEHIFYVWLQGESDAIHKVSCEDYLAMLIRLKDALKRDCGIERFGIIRVGSFTYDERDEVIMQAQEQAVKTDPDFVMLTRVTYELSHSVTYINPEAAGHFNNAGMTVIGNLAGEALGRVCNALS